MQVSIITITYNNVNTLEDTINSILNQDYKDIEYIIIDGGSTDGTLEIIKKHYASGKISKYISESDEGIYDALNKGIKLCTGNIIGLLHADDIYNSNFVISNIVDTFKNYDTDSVYGDLLYVSFRNINKVIRNWKSGLFSYKKLKNGWMPPHPTFFVKRDIYMKYGLFDIKYKIAADYEIMIRFLWKYKITIKYIPEVLVKMRTGGKSNKNFRNIILKSIEDYNIQKHYKLGNFLSLFLKNIRKIPQFFYKSHK